ncbi:hypothetical protein DdX_17837 [Ditylenchus destructor]|uniref:Uncharacterized protein n=1 Tax=Ditylenchus destructor TaxID=166010 RepID=A0AAD4MKZ7_9BILA|nr:hypothetical protein DdX_17837 [Ditylenchus destructor]
MKACFLTALLVCALMAGVLVGQEVPPEVAEFCSKCPKGDISKCVEEDGEWKCRTGLSSKRISEQQKTAIVGKADLATFSLVSDTLFCCLIFSEFS